MTNTYVRPSEPGAADFATLSEPPTSVTRSATEAGLRAAISSRLPGSRRMFIIVSRIVLFAGVLVAWQLVSGDPKKGALVDHFYVSKPSEIGVALKDWWDQGILLESIRATLTATIYGFLLGAGLGIIVGVILGSSPTLGAIFRPFIVALNSIPRLALVPLFVLWFGFGISAKVALVTTIVFFLTFYSTYEGVRDVEQRLLDVLKVMNASNLALQIKVRIPSAMAWIIQGLQVSIPYALVAAVTAEIIGSNTGVGFLIQRSAGVFYTAGVFAGIVVLVVMGLILNMFVVLLEKRLLRWKPRNLTRSR